MADSPAGKIRRCEFAGWGAVVQLAGLLLLFWLPLGPLLGLVLLYVGNRQSLYWVCSRCGGRLAQRDARCCPVCRAPFG